MAGTAPQTRKIVVLTSGNSRGSNLRAIAGYFRKHHIDIEIALVVVTRKQAPVLEVCHDFMLPSCFISSKIMEEYERKMLTEIQALKPDAIVLAGFMKQLSAWFLSSVKIPILNIHPALLPKYGGKGMFGINVHTAVFEAGEQISGATIHLVNEDYDKGQILAQTETDISDCRSPQEIAARVLKIEHELFAPTIVKYLNTR